MSPEENVALVRRVVQEILNTGDFTHADEFFAPEYVEHSAPPGAPQTVEGTKFAFENLHAGFPDFKYTIASAIAERDMVGLALIASGTMQGELFGKPPTGKHAEWQEIHIARLRDDKLVEHWDVKDAASRAQQLGAEAAETKTTSSGGKYARTVTGTTTPDKLDEVIRLWHEFVAPSAKQQKGFINARLLVNRESGQVISMGLWESKADFENSVQWNAGQLTQFTNLFPTLLTVSGFELAGEASSR
jgi:predicted ester cyclase